MDEDDGFIPVRRKAKARPARKPKPANPAAASSSGSRGFSYRASSAAAAAAAAADTDADLDLDLDLDLDVEQRTVEAVERALSMLDTHLPHLASVLDAVWPQPEAQGRRPTAVLCLGLGSVSTSRSAQIQLALLVRILRWLPHSHSQSPRPTTHACAFDPVFTHVDRAVLARYGVHADTHDHAGRYAITQDTLAFMPHCPLPLYERLVRTNSPTLHHRTLTLLANRLDRYADAMPHARLAARAPAIQRILHHLETVPLPNLPTPHADALNDLAFQRYTGAELDAQLGPEQELPRDPDGNEILH